MKEAGGKEAEGSDDQQLSQDAHWLAAPGHRGPCPVLLTIGVEKQSRSAMALNVAQQEDVDSLVESTKAEQGQGLKFGFGKGFILRRPPDDWGGGDGDGTAALPASVYGPGVQHPGHREQDLLPDEHQSGRSEADRHVMRIERLK